MKKAIKIIGIALVALGFAFNASAQVTASAYAEAHIITPLTIQKMVDLDFGNVAVINAPGTVVLSAASPAVRTSTGGATPVANPTGIVTAAEFDITGLANAQVFVTLPASPPGINVVHTNGIDFMNVTDFVCSPASGFQIPLDGTETIFVGATLNTNADQLPGTYHTLTDFDVTINYQ
jgi:hypothetical protein